MQVGYARAGLTGAADPGRVWAALAPVCDHVIIEAASGKAFPGLVATLRLLSPGAILIIPSIKHLTVGPRQPLGVVNALLEHGASVRTLDGLLDTMTPEIGALLRTPGPPSTWAAGILQHQASRKSSRGQPRAISAEVLAKAQKLRSVSGTPIKDVAAAVGVSRASLYRYLKER